MVVNYLIKNAKLTVLSQTYHIFKPKFYNVHNVFEKQTVIIIYSGIVPH